MIVLHAGFLDDRLLLWGETPVGEDAPQPQRPGRRSKALGRQPSPYDVGADLLSAALQCVGLPLLERGVRARKAVAWLPTAPEAFWGKGGSRGRPLE